MKHVQPSSMLDISLLIAQWKVHVFRKVAWNRFSHSIRPHAALTVSAVVPRIVRLFKTLLKNNHNWVSNRGLTAARPIVAKLFTNSHLPQIELPPVLNTLLDDYGYRGFQSRLVGTNRWTKLQKDLFRDTLLWYSEQHQMLSAGCANSELKIPSTRWMSCSREGRSII